MDTPLTPFTIALDWTPNVNHAGFFVAHSRGLYAARGLDVQFVSPAEDNYTVTPAEKVSDGSAQLAICPSESIISYATKTVCPPRSQLVAVAAVLAEDTSAIVTLRSSGITAPAQLDGKRYASYGARYEGRIVQQMIRNDGGDGTYTEDAEMPMLGIWDTLLSGDADATWVFMGWEGVIARAKGVELNVFTLADSQIPYGYSPVLVAARDEIETNADNLRAFLEASAVGWTAVAEEPVKAAAEAVESIAQCFGKDSVEVPDEEVMSLACQYVADQILPETGGWGMMLESRWDEFLDFLHDTGLLTVTLQSRQPVEGTSVTLDALRHGDVGELLPRNAVAAADLFSNALLPTPAHQTSTPATQ